MLKVSQENGTFTIKLAGTGGGGTIIVLTLELERTTKVLREASAEAFIELDPNVQGVKLKL